MTLQYTVMDGALAGQNTSQPDLKLSEAAMVNNSNVLIQDGEVQTSTLRLLEGEDNNENQIKIPAQAFNIISVDAATDTIIFSGDGSGIVTTDTIYIMNSSGDDNPSTSGPGIFYNDGYYTVDTIIEGGGNTTITTVESIGQNSIEGWVFFGTTEVLKAKSLLLEGGSEQIYIFTENNIFEWNLSGKSLDKLDAPYTLENITQWSVDDGTVNFGSIVTPDNKPGLICCTGIGRPLKIEDDGTVTVLDAEINDGGDYIANVIHCVFYNNYLLLGNVTLSTGDDFENVFYNSDLRDTENFNIEAVGSDASFFLTDGTDEITAFHPQQDNLIVFKSRSIIQMFFTGTADLFQLNKISNAIGCRAPDSIVIDRNHFLYFFATDKRFKVLRGLTDISNVIERTIRDIKDNIVFKIRGQYITDDNRLIWAIPIGANATQNNKVIIIKDGIWSFLDIECSAFVQINKVFTDSWNTISEESTWDNVVGAWNDVEGEEGVFTTLGADFSGNLFTMFKSYQDLGVDYESSVIISTDLNKKQGLNMYKRITKIRFYFVPKIENDTIYLDISRDNETTYTNLTSFTAYNGGANDINIINKAVSIRAKSFRFKIRSEDRFNLVGMIIYFEAYGDR